MESKGFSVGESLKFGWGAFKEHVGFFIGLLLLAFLSWGIPYALGSYFTDTYPSVAIAFFIIYAVLSLVVHMGLIKVSLSFTDASKARFRDLYTSFPLFFKFLGGYILYLLIILAGLILLVFPAAIWGTRYALFGYFIVDKGVGPITALKMSAKATMGAKWDLLGFYIVLYIIGLLGILCLGIGFFVAVPVSIVATAWVYRRLSAETLI